MLRTSLPRAARFHTTLSARTSRAYRPQAYRRAFASGPRESPPPKLKLHERIIVRIDRWIAQLPRFAQPPLVALRTAPTSYVVSFAILHELTAIVPLIGLIGLFHYTRWLPAWFAEGDMISSAIEKMGRYFRKKGWIDPDDEAEVERRVKEGNARMFEEQRQAASKAWNRRENASRLLVETATAWAVVKVLLVPRVILSAFWAPGFARLVVVPVGRVVASAGVLLRGIFSRRGT